jgi:hypothetical protein
MPRNIRSTATQVGEDVTDKAGWMYADLFLALMVIFLATISFVPEFRAAPTSNVEGTSVASSTMTKGANFQYSGFDPEKLKADIAKYRLENNLNAASKIVYVQVSGGYDSAKQNVNAGTVTAISFSVNMKKDLPELFNSADFKIDTSADLGPNSVSLRIVFA